MTLSTKSMTSLMLLILVAFSTACGKSSERNITTTGTGGSTNDGDDNDDDVDGDDNTCSGNDVICGSSLTSPVAENFERSVLLETNGPWRTAINDSGRTGQFVDVKIFGSELAPAGLGSKAVYMHGREGNSVHDTHLVSKAFSVGDTRLVRIRFKFLMVGLMDADEYFRVDVCHRSASLCGVGTTIDPTKLESTAWRTYFVGASADKISGPIRPNASHWRNAEVLVALNTEFPSDFIFKFSTKLHDGFVRNQIPSGNVVDLVGIDDVKVDFIEYNYCSASTTSAEDEAEE